MTKRDREPNAGTWCGVDVWRCPFCAYDSEDETKTRDHINEAHPLPPPPIEKPKKETVTNG